MRLVHGVGVNDADYVVQLKEELPEVNGKRKQKVLWICSFYRTWVSMLGRCYDENKYPTYIGCSVYDEWLTFSNFKSWMEQQDWKDKQLDKDLLFIGNKVYSPDTCVFVDRMINIFTIDRGAFRGEWPIGVHFDKQNVKFKAQCHNPFTKKQEHLGLFICPNQAHKAWQARKHLYACQLADLQQEDPRVAKALRERYAPDKDWTKA